MTRTFLILSMCLASLFLFYPSTGFTVDPPSDQTCACGPDCACEHCTTGKGACACQVEAKGACACGPDCACEHCTTGKGACACQVEAKGACACGPDCACEHCTTGKGACACQVEARGACACGSDCACEHCTTGKGACACRAGSGKGAADSGASKGLFNVTYKTDAEDIPLNAIHAWTITVTDAAGRPVTDAEISIDGGMPAHGHGLPTEPVVTKNLGNGSYLVEGVKFSMPGDWVMTFTINAGGKEDTVLIEFGL